MTAGTVVSHLLLDQELLHKTAHARDIFAGISEVRCVWTDDVVTKSFAIDHVLPFSLWRSNDLWNLLPAHPAVNNRKSDRLPERRFLLGRRSAVVACWDIARRRRPLRFLREAEGLAGVAEPLLDVLFEAMVEAVEVTALQRGADRWAP